MYQYQSGDLKDTYEDEKLEKVIKDEFKIETQEQMGIFLNQMGEEVLPHFRLTAEPLYDEEF